MSLGENIRRLRKSRALTQIELAKKAGLGHNTIQKAERDEGEIAARSLKQICDALGVSTNEVYEEKGPSFSVKLDAGAYMPVKAHEEDAGYDLFAPAYNLVPRKGACVIDTGVHIAIPQGFAGVLMSKSGLNVKHGLTSEGLIDSGYTGAIKVKLYNNSDTSYEVRPGDKISQIVFLPIASPELNKVDKLPETDRGDGGFGSTGR